MWINYWLEYEVIQKFKADDVHKDKFAYKHLE